LKTGTKGVDTSQQLRQKVRMAPSICGNTISSRRSLLATGWFVVNFLALFSFLSAFALALSAKSNSDGSGGYNYYNNNDGNDSGDEKEDQQQQQYYDVGNSDARVILFAALWTAVLASVLGIYGTVVLGFQVPVIGRYHWCFTSGVHRTTHLAIGVFIGALFMFANLTLICSILFWEFRMRGGSQGTNASLERSSLAFSILCIFLAVLYIVFAAITFAYSDDLIKENQSDFREEALMPSEQQPGYIGNERFRVNAPAATTDRFISVGQS